MKRRTIISMLFVVLLCLVIQAGDLQEMSRKAYGVLLKDGTQALSALYFNNVDIMVTGDNEWNKKSTTDPLVGRRVMWNSSRLDAFTVVEFKDFEIEKDEVQVKCKTVDEIRYMDIDRMEYVTKKHHFRYRFLFDKQTIKGNPSAVIDRIDHYIRFFDTLDQAQAFATEQLEAHRKQLDQLEAELTVQK